MDLVKELELRVIQLEKDHESNKDIIELVLGIVKELKAWRNQFKSKNGHGIIPRIIDGVTTQFETMLENHKIYMDGLFENHKSNVSTIVESIPCGKLLGDGCNYRIIGKDEPIPKGYKEIKG